MEKFKTIHENKVLINPPDEKFGLKPNLKRKHTPEYRIKKVMQFYYERGQNREFINKVYRKIIKQKFQKEVLKEINY